MENEKTIREEIVLTDEEMKQVEKGIYYYQIVDAEAVILSKVAHLVTTLEMMDRYKGLKEITDEEYEEIHNLAIAVKKAFGYHERISEMYKKHPLSP